MDAIAPNNGRTHKGARTSGGTDYLFLNGSTFWNRVFFKYPEIASKHAPRIPYLVEVDFVSSTMRVSKKRKCFRPLASAYHIG